MKALKYHPDKNSDPDCLETFKKIQEAKDVLTDPSLRRSYDLWLSSRIHVPFEQWQNRKAHAMHWASPVSKTLRIEVDSSRQGSDFKTSLNATNLRSSGIIETRSLLDKFRNYEI